MRRLLASIYQAWDTKPTAATLPLGMIVLGAYAIIRGEHVSRAFTNLGGGFIIRCIGVAMLLGGGLVAFGEYLEDPLYELVGLGFAAAGAGMFGLGVLFGLGELGGMAGGGFLLMSLGLLGRCRLLNRDAKRLAEARRQASELDR